MAKALSVEREVVVAHFLSCLDQQGAGAAGDITDASTGFAFGQLGEQGGNLGGGEEVACFLASFASEGGDEVHVCIADDVIVL